MRRARQLRSSALALVVAVALLGVPALVRAATAPTLAISAVSLTDHEVSFASEYETGTASVALVVNGEEVTRTAVPAAAAGKVTLSAPMPATAKAEAVARDGEDSVIGTSTPVAFSGADYAPTYATFGIQTNRLVSPSYVFAFKTSAKTKRATLYLNGSKRWSGPVAVVNGVAKLPPVTVRYGLSTARIVAENSWGSVSSSTIRVWQLGKSMPPYWRYVLVDKGDYFLYYVDGRVVKARFPVAIGMPGAATPTGTFRLWYPQPGGGAWGVIRMNLQRKTSSGFVRTSYYIHGTNDPDSIGTMASHGCVRMFNRDVLKLADMLKRYDKRPYAIIRN